MVVGSSAQTPPLTLIFMGITNMNIIDTNVCLLFVMSVHHMTRLNKLKNFCAWVTQCEDCVMSRVINVKVGNI